MERTLLAIAKETQDVLYRPRKSSLYLDTTDMSYLPLLSFDPCYSCFKDTCLYSKYLVFIQLLLKGRNHS